MRGVLTALVFSVLSAASSACPPTLSPDTLRATSTSHIFGLRFDQDPIPVGPAVTAEVHICHRDGKPYEDELEADATMPAHGHGMNYHAKVEPRGDGRYRVTGLVFHMPGTWRVEFSTKGEAGWERVDFEMQLH